MEASTLEGAGYPPSADGVPASGTRLWRFLRARGGESDRSSPPEDARRRTAALGRIFRLGVSDGTSPAGEAVLGELEMELALLREENARLKVERHRQPDPGRIIDRMRDLRQEPQAGQADDAVARVIIECLALRAGLLEACQEIQQAMQGMQSRLGTLSVAVEARGADQERRAGQIAVEVPVEGANLELAVTDGVSSDFAESAA
jgi:hypothetical protein